MYILLTKPEGRIGRMSARGLDSTERAQRVEVRTEKNEGRYFPQFGLEQARSIRDLLHDCKRIL